MGVATTEQLAIEEYRTNWGWLAVRGGVAMLFGLLTLAWPGMALLTLIIAFGAYAIVDGIADLVFVARGGKTMAGKSWPLVFAGLAGVGAGLAAILWPGATSVVMLYIIAAWALASGIFEIVAYFPLHKQIEQAWLMLFSGFLSVALGVLLMAWPATGVLAIIWMVGIYAIVAGLTVLALAFSIRRSRTEGGREPTEPSGRPPTEPTPA